MNPVTIDMPTLTTDINAIFTGVENGMDAVNALLTNTAGVIAKYIPAPYGAQVQTFLTNAETALTNGKAILTKAQGIVTNPLLMNIIAAVLSTALASGKVSMNDLVKAIMSA